MGKFGPFYGSFSAIIDSGSDALQEKTRARKSVLPVFAIRPIFS
jgi:hypothetical protein